MELTTITYNGGQKKIECRECAFVLFDGAKISTDTETVCFFDEYKLNLMAVWINGSDTHPLALAINGKISRMIDTYIPEDDTKRRRAFEFYQSF